MKLNALREQRSAKVAEMTALVNKAAEANRDLTADETKQFDSLKAEERSLAAQIERAEYLREVERRSVGSPVAGNSDNFEDLAKNVSVMKVLRAQMEGRSLDGVEREYAQEAERRSGRKAEGVYIPLAALETRATTTATASGVVPTDHRADQYIGPLFNRLLARKLGVRVLPNLHGDVSVPKYGNGLATGWVTEGGAVPEGSANVGNVVLTPKHVGGKTELSRQLIQQSSPAVEQLVRDDLAGLIAQQIDAAIFNGSGADGEPLGILNTPGVLSASLATLDHAGVQKMLEALELENMEAAHFVGSAKVRTALATTLKDAGIPGYILENGMISNVPFFSTNQVPNASETAGTLMLGDFSQVLLGVWSEVDILVNPFAEPAYSRGGVQVRAMATCDVKMRHPQGFVVADDVVIS